MAGIDPTSSVHRLGGLAPSAAGALLFTFALLFLSAGWMRRGLGVRVEVSRKYVHIAAMVTGAVLPFFVPRATLMLAAAIFIPVLLLMARLSLLDGVIDRQRSVGGPVLALCAYLVLLLVAPSARMIAVPMCVAGLADGAAGLVGSRTGVPRMPGSHRSWAGTATSFAVAFLVIGTAELGLLSWPAASASALVLAAAVASIEVVSPSQFDNLTVPLGTFVALQISTTWPSAELAYRLIELTAAVFVALIAADRRWLTVPGSFGLVVVALFSFWTVGWRGVAVLAAFFIASSVITRLRPERAVQTDASLGRGVGQVFAIAAGPLVYALGFWSTGREVWALAFVTAVAVACADTFGTEIGRFSRTDPYLLTSLRRVPRGTSGAISPLGTLAAGLGAMLVGGLAVVVGLLHTRWGALAALLGFVGALLDSALGASVQERWTCRECLASAEKRLTCHSGSKRSSGIPFLSNEAVNLLTVVALGCVSVTCGGLI